MKWLREPKVENHLKHLGVEFKVESVKLEQIDLKESLERQVRLKKLDDDLVMQYAEAQSQPGAAFPMCVLNRLPAIKLMWIVSGNHRIHACKLRDDLEIEAYIVSVTDPRIQDLLPRVVNIWEGKRPTKEEILLNAAWLIDNHRYEVKFVAQQLGLRPETINAYLRTQKVAQQIRDEGINADGIARSILQKMAPLASNRIVLKEATKLLKRHEIVGDEALQILDEVKLGTTEKERLDIIGGWNKTMVQRSEKPQPIPTSRRTRLLSLLSGLRNLLVNSAKFTELQLGPEDYQTVAQGWNDCDVAMRRLMREGGVK